MSPRIPLALTLALAVPLLAACGGDSDKSDKKPSAHGTPFEVEPKVLSGDDCDVKVELTGDSTASWTGKGSVSTENAGGPDAFYQASDDNSILTVYGTGNGFDAPNFILQLGDSGEYFGPAPGSKFKVKNDGSGVDIDTDVTGQFGQESGSHLVATFDC